MMKNKILLISLISCALSLLVFILSVFAWITVTNNNKIDGTGADVTNGNENNYIFKINQGEIASSDLFILPGEVKRYDLVTENILNANLSFTYNTIRNISYLRCNNDIVFNNIILNNYHTLDNQTIFYDNNNTLIDKSEEYNLYNGLYLSDESKIEYITDGTNNIDLYYLDNKKIVNTNEYYMNDSLYTLNNKESIFNNLYLNNNIENCIKYSYQTQNDSSLINWENEFYLKDMQSYTFDSNTAYLFLYFDPNIYPIYNNIVLRNSNIYLFQSLEISLLLSISG